MQTTTLPGTPVTTSTLGFGCAGLFRLADRKERAAVLREAVSAGIRHFDTAPMYGLGRSEAELAPMLRSRRSELTVTTKFGIEPSSAGRTAGAVQRPIRAVLARRPTLQEAAGESGARPESGTIGRMLYRAVGYDPTTAARSLRRSLRALRTDYIDIFMLHDPMRGVTTAAPELIAYLDAQVREGTIRCWGVAGSLAAPGASDPLIENAPVVQHHDDVFARTQPRRDGRATVTFGSLSRALPALQGYLRRDEDAGTHFSEQLGADVHDPTVLAGMLLREAARRNPAGVVLFSTTRRERVTAAKEALTEVDNDVEAVVLRAIVEAAAPRIA